MEVPEIRAETMNVASWNVWNRGEDLDRFDQFIESSDADLYAFQELTDRHIERLSRWRGYCLYLVEDFIEDGQLTHLGLLTRLPAENHEILFHNPNAIVSSSLLGRQKRWAECLQSQSLTIQLEDKKVEVVNVHLSCGVSPRRRLAELDRAVTQSKNAAQLIVCGDMNSFANPWLNAGFGWLFGFGLQDLPTNEIATLTRFAGRNGMQRVPASAVTYPRFRLQLDHIMVRGFSGVRGYVGNETFGSDHRPVLAELLI